MDRGSRPHGSRRFSLPSSQKKRRSTTKTCMQRRGSVLVKRSGRAACMRSSVGLTIAGVPLGHEVGADRRASAFSLAGGISGSSKSGIQPEFPGVRGLLMISSQLRPRMDLFRSAQDAEACPAVQLCTHRRGAFPSTIPLPSLGVVCGRVAMFGIPSTCSLCSRAVPGFRASMLSSLLRRLP